MAEKLDKYGIKIIGTSFHSLDWAEDRGRFSALLRDLGIPYPKFGTVRTSDAPVELSKELGFPLLVRPSYVRAEEHTSELQSRENLVCRLLLGKKNGI